VKKTALIVVMVLLAAVSAFAQTAADFTVGLNDAGDGVIIRLLTQASLSSPLSQPA
jgi:hypothetical protein